MTTKPAKLPKQLRIAFEKRKEAQYDEEGNHTGNIEYLLGYAIPYAPTTAAYKKAKESADNWAYSSRYSRQITFKEDEEGKMWRIHGHWEQKGFDHVWVNDEPIKYDDDVQPIIIDNVPLEGFKIDHMVSRERGNKLWRVQDPRGFQLEITSGCFEDLIFTGVVDKGLIVGPCIWRTGKILQRV